MTSVFCINNYYNPAAAIGQLVQQRECLLHACTMQRRAVECMGGSQWPYHPVVHCALLSVAALGS